MPRHVRRGRGARMQVEERCNDICCSHDDSRRMSNKRSLYRALCVTSWPCRCTLWACRFVVCTVQRAGLAKLLYTVAVAWAFRSGQVLLLHLCYNSIGQHTWPYGTELHAVSLSHTSPIAAYPCSHTVRHAAGCPYYILHKAWALPCLTIHYTPMSLSKARRL